MSGAVPEKAPAPSSGNGLKTKSKSTSSLGNAEGKTHELRNPRKMASKHNNQGIGKGILRGALVLSLLAAAGVMAGLAYKELTRSEENINLGNYDSVARSALYGAQEVWKRKLDGSVVMSTWLSWAAPNKEDWPNISIDGYIPISESIATSTSTTSQSTMVFVQPDNVKSLEDHFEAWYKKEGRSANAGVSKFGFGIWKPDLNVPPEFEDARLHDTDGTTSWGGKHKILTPAVLHNVIDARSLMYNLYSERDRGFYIDGMIECAEANARAGTNNSCYTVTDILELKTRPGPAALLFQPIYPSSDPTELVAFTTISLHWDEVLSSTVPDYVSGLHCIISTPRESHTYVIQEGEPVYLGKGDLHDTKYGSYAEHVVINQMSSNSTSSVTYTLTVYPTDEMFVTSNAPLRVALSFVAVIAVCGCLFYLYDYLIRSEANERAMILEMKRRFVRFISHEIRTPLNTVCMGLELLETEFTEKCDSTSFSSSTEDDIDFWRSVATDVRENASVAVAILNDLLNYDKLETGTMKLEIEKVDIWELIRKICQQFQIQAINKKVELNLILNKPKGAIVDEENGAGEYQVLRVVGDEVRLSQVLRNVLSNALKFTKPDGSVEILVEYDLLGLPKAKPVILENGEPCSYIRSGAVRIRVKDSGIGLSEQQLSQLFAEGVQFDANKLQHGGGSGLGLNIAKGIAEQHQGRIWAESYGIGMGTTFVVELPLYEVSPEEATALDDKQCTSLPVTEATSEENNPGPKLILVAEDADSSRKMLIRVLERSGYTCLPAVNGQEAVDIVQANMEASASDPDHVVIDMVLMDFEMPILKGPEATRKLRTMGYQGTVIGVTGNVLDEDVCHFLDHGADEVLPKPISLQRLKDYWEKMGKSKKDQPQK